MQPTIKSYFIDNKEKLSNFIPDIPWKKIMFYLSSHINKNEILLKCSKLSIFDSFRKAISMNLNLDPSYGEVSFVPYWNNLKKIYESELIPGYKAYIRIAHEIYDAKVFSGTFTYDDIKDGYFKGYDSIEKIIEIDSSKFLSTKIKSKDNISHVWVSIQTDIKRIDHLYSKEEIEERARYKDKIRTKSPWNSSVRKQIMKRC